MSLNEAQNRAVRHRGSGLLVLAGAGTGKTRVITHRIAELVDEGVPPNAIMAVTFTNKAAKEMRERLAAMGVEEGPWIGTFHATGLRILRMHGDLLGYRKNFTIYDDDAQKALVKALVADVELRGKKPNEGLIHHLVQSLKSRDLEPAAAEREDSDVPRSLRAFVREVFARYEEALRRSNAMDFADLLVNTVRLLRIAEGTPAGWLRTRFRHVLVDEFQDTNKIQMDMVDLLATQGEICVVGDDDQCLVRGTAVTMEDGSRKPIEEVRKGDRVLSCYGRGTFRGASVTSVFSKLHVGHLVRITTEGGRVLTSTPEHTHFAGFRQGVSPQTYVTYLMRRNGYGWRVGTSRVNAGAQEGAVLGFTQRLAQERGDAVWVVSSHATENEARLDEYLISLSYQIPTLPFVPRKGGSTNGLVHDSKYLDAIFARIDGEKGASRLLEERGFSVEHPHYWPRSRNSNRRNVTVTLCADCRGSTPMHSISITGNDEEGRVKLASLGFSVRPAKNGTSSWRIETAFKDFEQVQAIIAKLQTAYPFNVVLNARLAKNDRETSTKRSSLPFTAADSVMPGMVVFTDDGAYDVVTHVESVVGIEQVYDLNVEGTHNFVANGLITHNSIYGWRGADPQGMMRFSGRPGVKTVKLEENYRCTSAILDCANGLIARNTGRIGKTLKANKVGEPVRVTLLSDDRAEAQAVAKSMRQPWGNHAVLYRTHAQSRVIEEALRLHGIPYTIIGGLRFYDRAEVKDLLAYFRLAVNPRADMDLLRVANRPTRGMGPQKIGALKTFAARRDLCMYEALKEVGDEKADNLREILTGLAQARHSAVTLLDFFEETMRLTGYRDALVKTARGSKSIVQREKAQSKVDNVDELANDLADFSARHVGSTVDDYVEHVALVSSFDKEGGPVVSLMTIHAAKGLEFPHVHLVGFEEGIMPHMNSLKMENPVERAAALEEERRLAYVAITRAKDMLDVTLTRIRARQGRPERADPSRFLDELPRGAHRRLGF